ncbi:MAG: fatty acid desaturase [Phycisphaeraceae bacterium]|nr:fatty acid desaturase [Phycisphaeraceae bacterium]
MSQALPHMQGVDRRNSQAAYARLLLPQRVKELSRRSAMRPVLDTAACWLLIASAWVAVAWQPVWWVVLPAFAVIGNRYYALFIIGHDALHRRLFERRKLNDRFADLFIFAPIGAITRLNNRNHLLHHAHLATDRDPDHHKYACFGKAGLAPLLGFLTGLTSVARSAANVFLRRKSDAKDMSSRDGYRLADVLILGAWQGGLIAGLTLAIGWWAYPVLWLAPVYVFAILADNLRSFCEHSHTEADHVADEHRLITYHSPALERCLVAPMSMNYHTAHHLWPTIPYYRLRQADTELIAAAGQGTDMVWRRSYVGYLWRYMRSLPIDGCDKPAHQAMPPAETLRRRAA